MSGFRAKLKAAFKDGTWSAQPATEAESQQPYARAAPPVPYWTAQFALGKNVSDEWRQELGDNGWGNNELQNYTDSAENSFFRVSSHGYPCLVLRAVVKPGQATSARLTSRVTLGRDQGYLSARITAPAARGVWPAFWMLPSEPFSWPVDGEVDIMESWNEEKLNHSCLHWGHYNAEENDRHRVVRSQIPALNHPEGRVYGFAWNEPMDRMMWYIDGAPVMQTHIPKGIRRISEFEIKLNIALGGNVCNGVRPADGNYEMEVHDIGMFEGPPGGWDEFSKQLLKTPGGEPIN